MLALALVLWTPERVAAQVDTSLWVTNGAVLAIAHAGGKVYLGGTFTSVGPSTGGGVSLDASSLQLGTNFPHVEGPVYASAPDGAGGWFIGGAFSSIGGQSRSNLAHVRADGTLESWAPLADSAVSAIAVSGNTVYAGGSFAQVDGHSRRGVAALDAHTGAVTAWDAALDGRVDRLALGRGHIYVAGEFQHAGELVRRWLASIDSSSATPTGWAPEPGGRILTMTFADSVVYVGGYFTTIGGQPRGYVAALDTATGAANAWAPPLDIMTIQYGYIPYVDNVAAGAGVVYLHGSFTGVGGNHRGGFAAIDAVTAAPTNWTPDVLAEWNLPPSVLLVAGDTLYVSGAGIAAVSANTGATLARLNSFNGRVESLSKWGAALYAGGDFSSVGAEVRPYLAALDETTGMATEWNPAPDGPVTVLAVAEGTLYASGYFSGVAGQSRTRLAAFDVGTGALTSWDPSPDDLVQAILPAGSSIFAGGSFHNIGGQPRACVASLDASTGLANPFDALELVPNPETSPEADVKALARYGSTLFVGGDFSEIGGQTRYSLAALDANTGLAAPWNAHMDSLSAVYALATSDSALFVGGLFHRLAGQQRPSLAMLSPTTAQVSVWNPRPFLAPSFTTSGLVRALVVRNGGVYVGGRFGMIGGQYLVNFAGVDRDLGNAITGSWSPGGTVYAVDVDGGRVFVGGNFTTIAGRYGTSFAGSGDILTPDVMLRFDVHAAVDRVRAEWQFGRPDQVESVRLERSGASAGPWQALALEAWNESGVMVSEDMTAEPGTAYFYRLWVRFRDGSESVFGPLEAELEAHRAIEFTGILPNPAAVAVAIEYALKRETPARVEILDLAGRSVAVLTDRTMTAGVHIVKWDGRRAGIPVPSGIYFVRFRADGISATRRLVICR